MLVAPPGPFIIKVSFSRLKRERYGEVGMDQMRDWLGRIAL